MKAVEALANPETTAQELRGIASDLDGVSARYGSARVAVAYSGFADLLRIVSALVEWRAAVLEATVDADRFVRSAKARYRSWRDEYGEKDATRLLAAAAAPIEVIDAPEGVEAICYALACVPLPIGVFEGDRSYRRGGETSGEEKPAPAELSVAFLKFLIDGQPANDVHHLVPNEVHDLSIEVRVSRWPDSAEQLQLTPASIEPASSYDFPIFTLPKPAEGPPFVLVQRGRALLRAAQSLQARPFEFKYTASFLPAAVEQPVAIIGHRTLLIEGLDLRAGPITGYPPADRKILEIRDSVRRGGLVRADDLGIALRILIALANLAARASQDAEFDGVWSEDRFQEYVRKELRRRPEIGAELDEHAHAAGGITDLSLRGVPIELKSEPGKAVDIDGCTGFAEQTAAYAIAKGKRVGVLCVLDCSPKTSAVEPVESGIGLINRQTQSGHVAIITVIVRGNLKRPSRLKPPPGFVRTEPATKVRRVRKAS